MPSSMAIIEQWSRTYALIVARNHQNDVEMANVSVIQQLNFVNIFKLV